MMFKVANGQAPKYLTDSFTLLSESNSGCGRVTRGQTPGNLKPSAAGTELGRRRLASHGSNQWNALPDAVKVTQSTNVIKSAVKTLPSSILFGAYYLILYIYQYLLSECSVMQSPLG